MCDMRMQDQHTPNFCTSVIRTACTRLHWLCFFLIVCLFAWGFNLFLVFVCFEVSVIVDFCLVFF